MQIKTNNEIISVDAVLYEGTNEHSIEAEIIIPDYLPDLTRVVKVDAEQKIRDFYIQNDKIVVEGVVNFNVFFISQSDSMLRSFAYPVQFDKKIDVKANDNANCDISSKLTYLNCRITGPRKAALRADIALLVNVTASEVCSIASGITDERDDIEILYKNVKMAEMVCNIQKNFKIFEDIEMGRSKQPISEILKSDATSTVSEIKIIKGKAVIKGEMSLKILYIPESDESQAPEVMKMQIPFSQILDISGIDEDCECMVTLDVTELITKTVENGSNEKRIISVEATVKAYAKAYKNKEVSYIADVFCTKYNLEQTNEKYNLKSNVRPIFAEQSFKETVTPLTEDLAGIIDVCAYPVIKQKAAEANMLTVNGTVEISVLTMNTDGGIENIDKTIPFKVECETDGGGKPDINISLSSLSYNISGNDALDIRFDLTVNGLLMTNEIIFPTTEMEVDENSQRERNKANIVVYYTEPGENIWEIAKKYKTSRMSIMESNRMTDETAKERFVIVPL